MRFDHRLEGRSGQHVWSAIVILGVHKDRMTQNRGKVCRTRVRFKQISARADAKQTSGTDIVKHVDKVATHDSPRECTGTFCASCGFHGREARDESGFECNVGVFGLLGSRCDPGNDKSGIRLDMVKCRPDNLDVSIVMKGQGFSGSAGKKGVTGVR